MNTKPKMTPWFPPITKPVHAGVYLTRLSRDRSIFDGFAHWDGGKWSCGWKNEHAAASFSGGVSVQQAREWRGLTRPVRECLHEFTHVR